MSKEIKLSLLFAVVGMIATVAVYFTQMEMLASLTGNNQANNPINDIPPYVLVSMSSLQTGILGFVMALIGLKLAPKVQLHLPFLEAFVEKRGFSGWSKKWLLIAIFGGVIGMAITLLLDEIVFAPYMPTFDETQPVTWWKGLVSGVLYGGIYEEVMLRLFLMTVIIWLLAKLTRRLKDSLSPAFYWSGIIVSSILFGAGHLPATYMLFAELTPVIIARALLLNGLMGVFFGYLFWKKGLEHSMISHMSAHVFLYGLVYGVGGLL